VMVDADLHDARFYIGELDKCLSQQ
jgi:hypothetical protein